MSKKSNKKEPKVEVFEAKKTKLSDLSTMEIKDLALMKKNILMSDVYDIKIVDENVIITLRHKLKVIKVSLKSLG